MILLTIITKNLYQNVMKIVDPCGPWFETTKKNNLIFEVA